MNGTIGFLLASKGNGHVSHLVEVLVKHIIVFSIFLPRSPQLVIVEAVRKFYSNAASTIHGASLNLVECFHMAHHNALANVSNNPVQP